MFFYLSYNSLSSLPTICLLVFFASCSVSEETGKDDKKPVVAVKKETTVSKPAILLPQDTCSARPSEKAISALYDKAGSFEGSCNAEGQMVANHEFVNDTLTIYSCWISVGDPVGFENGSRIVKYHWNCHERKFEKKDARIHIDIMGVAGGTPLGDYEMDDTTAFREREEFKRGIEQAYGGHFIIGKEADIMYSKTRKFLEKDIKKASRHWKEMYGSSAFWRED